MKNSQKLIVSRVLLLQNGSVYLMLRNGKGTKYGTNIKRWISPGGLADPGEDAITSAVRETKEELGIFIKPENLTLVLKKYDPMFNADMYFYVCKEWKGKISIPDTEKEKFDRAEWIKLKNVNKLENETEKLGIYMNDAILSIGNQPVYTRW